MNTGPKYVQVLYVGGIIICLNVAEWNNKREFLLGLYLQMGLFSCQLMHREKENRKKKSEEVYPTWFQTQPNSGQDYSFWELAGWGKSRIPLELHVVPVKNAHKSTPKSYQLVLPKTAGWVGQRAGQQKEF